MKFKDGAILDIELGKASGLDLCRALLEINPCTKVVYLTPALQHLCPRRNGAPLLSRPEGGHI